MRTTFIIFLAVLLIGVSFGCGSDSDNPNTNVGISTPTATRTAETDQNANAANANVNQDAPVPTFTDANTAFAEGNKYFDKNENEKAIEAFKQTVKLNPDLAEAHFKLGVTYALIEMQKSVDPDAEPAGNVTKGKSAGKRNSVKAFEEAVRAYKKIIAENPQDDAAFYNLGRSYNKLNEDKEAEKALRQAVKLKPEDSYYQTELGAILIKFAKYDEALGVLRKAIKLDESNSQAQDLIDKAQAGKKRREFGQPKEKPKDKPKDEPKDQPTDEPKDEPKDGPKDDN